MILSKHLLWGFSMGLSICAVFGVLFPGSLILMSALGFILSVVIIFF